MLDSRPRFISGVHAPVGLTAFAAEYQEAEKLFFAGDYQQCAKQFAAAEVERGVWNEKWPALLIRCQLTTGDYRQAEQILRRRQKTV